MPIYIGNSYKLEATKYNIVLFSSLKSLERSDRMKESLKKRWGDKPKESSEDDDNSQSGWRVAGYFSNIGNALNHLINLEVENSDLKDVQTVVDIIKKATVEIKEALSKIPTENLKDSLKNEDKLEKDEE